MKKAYTTIELLVVVIGIPLTLGLIGGMGYVAWHFVAKFW